MSPATDTSTNTPATAQQAAVESQTSTASLEQPPSASFANLTRSFYKTYLEGLAALKAGPTAALNTQAANIRPAQAALTPSISQANVEAFASPDFNPRSQQLPEDSPSKALINFQEQSWRTHSHLPGIASISYKQHFMRSHDAFTSLAIRPFSISVSSINLDIHLDITTKLVGIDHFFENSITPLRRSRKA